MYDCIVLEIPDLPAGVTLPAVLEGCDQAEVAEVLQPIPDKNNITKQDLQDTGDSTSLMLAHMPTVNAGTDSRMPSLVLLCKACCGRSGCAETLGNLGRSLAR